MFIYEDVLVDLFITDLKAVVLQKPIRELLRVPFLADQRFDYDPGGCFYAKPGLVASIQNKLMSLLGSISFQSTIAPQFSAGGGTRSEIWRQMISNIVGHTQYYSQEASGALGAAYLASIGTGHNHHFSTIRDEWLGDLVFTEPESDEVLLYRSLLSNS